MTGMIPGVGVPHRRINSRVHSDFTGSHFLGDRSNDSSMDLSETVLKARQRLEKKLGSCIQISPRLSKTSTKSKGCEDNGSSGSSKFVNVKRSLKFTSTNNNKIEDCDTNVRPFCC